LCPAVLDTNGAAGVVIIDDEHDVAGLFAVGAFPQLSIADAWRGIAAVVLEVFVERCTESERAMDCCLSVASLISFQR
jgi:hypothetical protein